MKDQDDKLLLGKHAPVAESYSPELLYPIARQEARSALGWIMEHLADVGGHGLELARLAELATGLHLSADEREDAAARNGEGMGALKESGAISA